MSNVSSLIDSGVFRNFVEAYSIALYTSFGVTSITYMLIIYVVIRKSTKEMQIYKWYMASHIVWSYCFHFMLCMFQPVPLFPLHVAYVAGWTKVFGPLGGFVQVEMLSCMGYATYVSLLLALLYRYTQVVKNPLSFVFTRHKLSFSCNSFILVIGVIVIAELLVNARPDNAAIHQFLQIQDSSIEDLSLRESVFGYEYIILNPDLYIFISLALLFSLISVLLLIYILINYGKCVKKMPVLCSSSYKLKKMLYKTIVYQFTMFFGLLIMPMVVVMLCVIWRVKFATFLALPLWFISSLHALADFLCILYFVRPYKRYCKYLYRRISCQELQVEPNPATEMKSIWKLQYNVARAVITVDILPR